MNDLMVIGESVKLELRKSAVRMPKNYSFENALKSAYLILKETVDRNKRPALEVCTEASVHDAILDMAVQGLNPIKNQCYFIVYGQQLQMIRSYMGGQMVAKQVDPGIKDIRAQVVYSGDEVDMEIVNGNDHIKGHKRPFSNISKADIIGAYALAIGHNDNQLHCEVMTIDEIKQSWKQSKMSAVSESGMINQSTTHGKFTGEMAKRTVINRLCKRIINTSDDAELIKSVERTDEDTPEQQIIEKQIANESNKKVLDFPAITSSPAEPDSAPSNDAEKQEMKATKQQFERIIQIESDKEKLIKMMSDFAGRKIERVSELTEDEAESFILKFDQNKDLDNINDPAWG